MVVYVPYPPCRDSYPLIRSSVVKIVCVHLAFGFGYKQPRKYDRASSIDPEEEGYVSSRDRSDRAYNT